MSVAPRFSLSFCLFLALISDGNAQSASDNAAFQFSVLDFAVPTSPAFTALDVTPETIIRPQTPRDYVLGLLNGTDPNGNLQTGLALDSVPYFIFRGNSTTLGNYQRWSPWERALKTSGFSLATTKANDDDDDAVRLGIGIESTVLDTGDPRLDKGFVQCVRDELEAGLPSEIPPNEDGPARQRALLSAAIADLRDQIASGSLSAAELLEKQDELKRREAELEALGQRPAEPARNAAIAEAIGKKCQENLKYRSNLWNRSAISVGFAPTFLSKSGGLNDLSDNGISFWGSVAYGFDGFARPEYEVGEDGRVIVPDEVPPASLSDYLQRHGQLLLHARYRGSQEAQFRDQFTKQDILTSAARFRLVYDKFNINTEGAFIHADLKDGLGDDDYYRVSLGADIKIPQLDNIYLSLGIGGEFGRTDQDTTFLASALKWRFGPTPTILPGS